MRDNKMGTADHNKKYDSTAVSRLRQDYILLKQDPIPYIVAEPLQSNLFEWHYLFRGPENTPYEGGIYHGKLTFPRGFPFEAPSFYMITPNGRFKTEISLCLNISNYHPNSWTPAWSVSALLMGLLSFMLENSPTFGSIETSDTEKRSLAVKSIEFNLQNEILNELFPEAVEEMKQLHEARLKSANSGTHDPSVSPAKKGGVEEPLEL